LNYLTLGKWRGTLARVLRRNTERERESRSKGETACPTSLQLLDLLWWGRRFRVPIRAPLLG
jgi:hypothetical protein